MFRLLLNCQDHSAAYHKLVLVPVVQQFLQPTLPTLPTPASTPRDRAPTPLSLSSQHITQEEELDPNGQTDQHESSLVEHHDRSTPAIHHQHENLFVDPHYQNPSVVAQGPSQGGRPANNVYTNDARDKQTLNI